MAKIIKHPTLYKIDTKGKIRVWKIEQQGNKFWTVAGLQDGEQVISDPTTCKGKNTGRANETSAVEQATAEVKAKYKKKLKGEYHTTIKDVNKKRFVKPMLAEKMHECEDCIVFPGWVQRKHNGARCIDSADGQFSRKGEPWLSAPHTHEDLKAFFKAFPNAILDGELYCDLFAHDLGSTMSLIRKKKPTTEDLKESAKVVQYYVFNLITDGTPNFEKKSFSERRKRLSQLFAKYVKANARVKIVEAIKVHNMQEIKNYAAQFISEGYEGLMFYNDTGYVYKRSTDLLKYKEFQDKEYVVLAVQEGKGNRAGMCGAFILGDDQGRAFKSTPKGNRDYFREILQNEKEYRGKLATVKFVELTPKQPRKDWKEYIDYSGKKWHMNTGEVPFHGNVIAIREDI